MMTFARKPRFRIFICQLFMEVLHENFVFTSSTFSVSGNFHTKTSFSEIEIAVQLLRQGSEFLQIFFQLRCCTFPFKVWVRFIFSVLAPRSVLRQVLARTTWRVKIDANYKTASQLLCVAVAYVFLSFFAVGCLQIVLGWLHQCCSALLLLTFEHHPGHHLKTHPYCITSKHTSTHPFRTNAWPQSTHSPIPAIRTPYARSPLPLKYNEEISWDVGVFPGELKYTYITHKTTTVKLKVLGQNSGVTTPIKQVLENKFCVTNHVSQFPWKDLCKLMYVMYVMYVCSVDEDDVGEIDENVDHKRDVNEIDIDHVADQKREHIRDAVKTSVYISTAHIRTKQLSRSWSLLSRSCQSCMVHCWKAVIYENVERFFAGFLWERVVHIWIKSCHKFLHDSPGKIVCNKSLPENLAGSMSQTCLCENSSGHPKIPSSCTPFYDDLVRCY